MARKIILTGTSPNDKTGDKLRDAFNKINDNFLELYNTTGADNPADRLINGAKELVLNVDGDRSWVDFPAAFGNNITVQGSEIGAASTLAMFSNNDVYLSSDALEHPKLWVLDKSGTITTPLMLPLSFTAVLDESHMTRNVGLTDTPWQFEVQFQVDQNGSVQTMMDNPFPNPVNPGYVSGDEFTFVEADHGIPGYTFTITLNDVYDSGPHWTANVAVSQPPAYPSTINSSGAIKLTSNDNSWTFGTTGKLQLPPGGDIVDSNGDTVLGGNANTGNISFLNDDIYNFNGITLENADLTHGATSAVIIPANGDTGALQVNNSYGPISIMSGDGAATQTWTFGADGVLGLGNVGAIYSNQTTGAITIGDFIGPSGAPAAPSTTMTVGGSTNVFAISAYGPPSIGWAFGRNGTFKLPSQAETLRNVGDISTAKIYRATNSTDPLVIREARNVWFSNETEFTFIVEQEEMGRGSNFPWHGMPSWEAYPLILSYSGGGLPPSTAMGTAAKAASDSYIAYKELESNIDIVSGDKTFSFENTGSLSLPGELTFADMTKAKIIVGALEEITWTFGADGSTTFPNGVIFDGSEGNKFALNSGTVSDIDLRDDQGRGFYTENSGLSLRSNGNNTWTFGTDANLAMPQLAKLSVVGNTPTALTSLENIYNGAEASYSDELANWITVNGHTPVWYLLPGARAYQQLAHGDYDNAPWIGTATLKSLALAALNAHVAWQDGIGISKLTVKSDTAAWTFDSTNKLTLSKGGVVAGGDPAAIQAAWNDYLADEADWQDLITSGGLDTNIRPWNFAGPSRAEKQAVLTAMWATQNEAGEANLLGWVPISASLRAQVNAWLAITVNQNGYENWKKLTTAVNITSEDKTWSFTNDGKITFPGDVQLTSGTHTFSVDQGGQVYIPGPMIWTNTTDVWQAVLNWNNTDKFFIASSPGDFKIRTSAGTAPERFWNFGTDGALSAPGELTIATNNTHGGAGYTGFLTLTSTQGGVTNPNKFIRMNETGNLQIVDSAYQNTIFDLADNGNLALSGNLTFPDGSVQSKAFEVVTIPSHSTGQAGHKQGMVAFDANNFYYCTLDYDPENPSVDIWVRVTWTSNSW